MEAAKEFPGVAVADISDACDELAVPAVRTGSLRPVWPGCPQVIGAVATLSMQPASDPGNDPLPGIVRAMTNLSSFVIMLDLGGRTDLQCWGGVLTACAQRMGVRAVIVNGAVRDAGAIAGRNFPVFARAVYPGRIRGRLRLAAVGSAVSVDGAAVHPGDLVAADDDGAIFLPSEYRTPVMRLAGQQAARDQERLALLAAGTDPCEVFPST